MPNSSPSNILHPISNLLMIRPVNFGFNEETAHSNAFQDKEFGIKNKENAQKIAVKEFDEFVEKLRNEGIKVLIIEDTLEPATPDSIFPNNWISFHENGTIVTYPMEAHNRRLERREDIIQTIENQFIVNQKIDLTSFEKEGKYLEGTGSMVLDRTNKIAYACLSPRTNSEVLNQFGEQLGYEMVVFKAVDSAGKAIYHTNVLMCVATDFVVICLDAIPDKNERDLVKKTIEMTNKKLIEISFSQMNKFAGNMLELTGNDNTKYLVMSDSAFESLSENQITIFEKYCKIIHSDLSMIEGNGGGSARCMMAEVLLEVKN
ncbi:MAG: arginine deiminase-related protein [Bacteroidota bacterium]